MRSVTTPQSLDEEKKQDSLPLELSSKIYLCLSNKELALAMLVSKAWYIMVSDSFIADLKNNPDSFVTQNRLHDALVYAVRKKHFSGIQKLISMGANINRVHIERKYELALMLSSDDDIDPEQIKQGKLYLREKDNHLTYTAITPHGLRMDVSLANMPVPYPFTLAGLNELKEQILDAVSKHASMKIAILDIAAKQGTIAGNQEDADIVLLLLRSKVNVSDQNIPIYGSMQRLYYDWWNREYSVEFNRGFFKQTEENKHEPMPIFYCWHSINTLIKVALFEIALKENNSEQMLQLLNKIAEFNPIFTKEYLHSFSSTPANASFLGIREELTQGDRNKLLMLPEFKSLSRKNRIAARCRSFENSTLVFMCIRSLCYALAFLVCTGAEYFWSGNALKNDTIRGRLITASCVATMTFLLIELPKLALSICKNKAISTYKYLRNEPRETYLKAHQLHFPLSLKQPIEFKNVPLAGLFFKPALKGLASQQSHPPEHKGVAKLRKQHY